MLQVSNVLIYTSIIVLNIIFKIVQDLMALSKPGTNREYVIQSKLLGYVLSYVSFLSNI